MTRFTRDAESTLERYLQRVRLSLRGTRVDAEEVERDVREHIDAALAAHDGPVGGEALEGVLHRLGSPSQWVPEEEVPAWRRILQRWQLGTEDWRLAYLCFGLFTLGVVTAPWGGPLLWIPAYFLARAARTLAAGRGEALGARAWLIYPPMMILAVALALPLLAGPLLPFAGLVLEKGWAQEIFGSGRGSLLSISQISARIGLIGLAVGAWWMLLAPLSRWAIRPLRALLAPLLDRYERRHAVWLGLAGVAATIACGSLLFAVWP